MAQEICDREGFTLYDLEYLAPQKVVRVYVDKEGGVSLDDCATVSSGLNFLLDVEDPIESNYTLEVSSPGLERSLKQKWHFEAQKGKKIRLVIKARTETAKNLGAKTLSGILTGVNEQGFTMDAEGKGSVDCPYEDVHKCNLVFDHEFNFKAKK